jgi:hypothetical protein
MREKAVAQETDLGCGRLAVDVDRQAVSIVEDATPHIVGFGFSLSAFCDSRRSLLAPNVAISIQLDSLSLYL